MQSLKNMMKRVGNNVSKKSADYVEQVYSAVKRGDFTEAGMVKLDPQDYAMVFKYIEACAKKAGVIVLLMAAISPAAIACRSYSECRARDIRQLKEMLAGGGVESKWYDTGNHYMDYVTCPSPRGGVCYSRLEIKLFRAKGICDFERNVGWFVHRGLVPCGMAPRECVPDLDDSWYIPGEYRCGKNAHWTPF